jgi:hypothetical protein
MKRWGKQNPAHLDEMEMRTDLGCDNFIFVGSSCDIFANNIPDDWIKTIIDYAHSFKNDYLFQTKNPERFTSPPIGLSAERDILCTTIETDQYLPEIMRNSPSPFVRAKYLSVMRERGFRTMVTIEPIMDFCLEFMLFMLKKIGPEQVNIGADSGGNRLPEPTPEKIAALIKALRSHNIKVHLKNNLKRLYKEAV